MAVRPNQTLPRGRPKGSRSFNQQIALSFGQTVLATRLKVGLSQEQLAYAADLERSYFGRIERGQSQPTLHALLKIAAALGCDVATLLRPVEKAWRGRLITQHTLANR